VSLRSSVSGFCGIRTMASVLTVSAKAAMMTSAAIFSVRHLLWCASSETAAAVNSAAPAEEINSQRNGKSRNGKPGTTR